MIDLNSIESKTHKNFVEVVLTGGPSAGKTTALSKITEYYRERGVRVITVGEVATTMMTNGLSDLHTLRQTNPMAYNNIQAQFVLIQRAMRKNYQKIAKALAPEKVLIVYDRAECDCRAYMEDEVFQAFLQENRLTMEKVRDSYDTVIHMVTAADGAAEHYDYEGNPARLENVEQAIDADRRTIRAWLGHPHLRVVDNSTGIDEKIERLLGHINHTLTAIGVGGESVEYERRFLLRTPPEISEEPLLQAKAISVEQTYLLSDKEDEVRVRKWADGSQISYFWTRKRPLKGEGREEREALIKPSEYVHLLSQADPDRSPIRKTRFCFVHDGRHCELDRIHREGKDIWILEVELTSSEEAFTPPDTLDIEKEVTDDPEYSNKTLAIDS